jgi:hypothetical protein
MPTRRDAPASLEAAIDALYRLPPSAFTAARNALAREQTGQERERVRRLEKPSTVPWVVNQLYWRERQAFDRLVRAGAKLRAAQIDALEGRKSDVASATAEHREAVGEAVRRAQDLARTDGIRLSVDALARMLEAISTAASLPERAGRLTAVVSPAGFDAVAGVAAAPPRSTSRQADRPRESGADHRSAARQTRQRELESARAAAAAALEAAEQAHERVSARLKAARVQLAELETAGERAQREVRHAQEAVRRVERALKTVMDRP